MPGGRRWRQIQGRGYLTDAQLGNIQHHQDSNSRFIGDGAGDTKEVSQLVIAIFRHMAKYIHMRIPVKHYLGEFIWAKYQSF
jgi:hypothetical protein